MPDEIDYMEGLVEELAEGEILPEPPPDHDESFTEVSDGVSPE